MQHCNHLFEFFLKERNAKVPLKDKKKERKETKRDEQSRDIIKLKRIQNELNEKMAIVSFCCVNYPLVERLHRRSHICRKPDDLQVGESELKTFVTNVRTYS